MKKWKLGSLFIVVTLSTYFIASQVTSKPTPRNFDSVVLSNSPEVRLYKNFLSPRETQELIALAKTRLVDSHVWREGKDVRSEDTRSSSSAHFYKSENKIIKKIEKQACAIVGCDVSQVEPIQIVHYTKDQKYVPHYDYFSEEDMNLSDSGQRLHTFLVYLNDLEDQDGGKTTFPKLDISVKPEQGMALYFRDANQFGQVDPLTLHGGDVIQRDNVEKWACNVWIRQKAVPKSFQIPMPND